MNGPNCSHCHHQHCKMLNSTMNRKVSQTQCCITNFNSNEYLSTIIQGPALTHCPFSLYWLTQITVLRWDDVPDWIKHRLRWNRTVGHFLFIHLVTTDVPRMLKRCCISKLDAVHSRYLPFSSASIKTITELNTRSVSFIIFNISSSS
jgi:hypothetical protein